MPWGSPCFQSLRIISRLTGIFSAPALCLKAHSFYRKWLRPPVPSRRICCRRNLRISSVKNVLSSQKTGSPRQTGSGRRAARFYPKAKNSIPIKSEDSNKHRHFGFLPFKYIKNPHRQPVWVFYVAICYSASSLLFKLIVTVFILPISPFTFFIELFCL